MENFTGGLQSLLSDMFSFDTISIQYLGSFIRYATIFWPQITMVASMMYRDRITMVATSRICSILFHTVKRFEISGFDRYSIRYSQA